MTASLDRELERELHRILDPITVAPVPVRRPIAASRYRARKLLGGAGAALGLKALTGFAIAAMAATAAGAATEAVITGSFNPADWGHQVRHQVTSPSNQPGTAVTAQPNTGTASGIASQSTTGGAGSTAGHPAGASDSSSDMPSSQPTTQGSSPVGTDGSSLPKGPGLKLNPGTEREPTDPPGMHPGPPPVGPET